jgi:predicted RNase H-like HicB family nuclease
MEYTIETEQEVDGRWIAEVVEVPGALAYGQTKEEAIELAKAIVDSTSAASDPHNLL